MINAAMYTWVPTVERFLSSWALYITERSPDKSHTLPDGYSRADLASHCNELKGHLERVQRTEVELGEVRACRIGAKKLLRDWIKAYNLYCKTISPEQGRAKVLMRTPLVGTGAYHFGQSTGVVQANWERLNAERLDASLEPVIIAGVVTVGDFKAKNEEWQSLETRVIVAERARRSAYTAAAGLVKQSIYPRLLAYRRMVASQFQADHSVMLSLPRLHPVTVKDKKAAKQKAVSAVLNADHASS
ncbi:MAG: hypothetical protein SFY80_06060 [Verrucomicrobiota bacterium]|nr:hypothetical protein [Verrucomicrobiota bacterium]